jgi:phospholipid/cholesterol/gamma-HCH transport system permease protein
MPVTEALLSQLNSSSTVDTVCFDLSQLQSYDSSLISLLVEVAKRCQKYDAKLDNNGLPEGVRQLLKMALAVPERKTHQAPEQELFFTRLGKAGLTLGASVLELFTFLGVTAASFGRLLRGKAIFRGNDTWLIIQRCGAEALAIVTLINFLIGVILGFVGGVELQKFGAPIYMADLVGIAMVRELGCIMTGIIMSGRTGAAFAAEIGSMKVNQEIDALRTLGFSPMDFLVMPRMLAMICMMPLLTAYGNVMGMVGGGVLSPLFDISLAQYYNQLVGSINLANYAAGIIKSFFFGVIVAGSGCLKGIQSGNSSSAVGMATTSAVVTAITAIIMLDAVFAFAMTMLGI